MPPTPTVALAVRLDAILSDAVARGVAPGLAAVLTDRERTYYAGGAGETAAGGPAGPDSVFRIASMTKVFTSIAALQLVDRGRLTLDTPVGDVRPEFDDLQVLDGFDGDRPVLRPAAARATVRHLLTHTSGAGYWFANADLLAYHRLTGLPDVFSGDPAALRAPLVADPGDRWEYGTSTDWLGLVVEEVGRTDLETYLRNGLFGPLGMDDTTFRRRDSHEPRRMGLHERTPDGRTRPSAFALPDEPAFLPGGHGAFSTPADIARLMRAVLHGGELDGARVLSADLTRRALADNADGVDLPAVIPTAVPEITNDMRSFPLEQSWGLAWQLLLEDVPGMRRAGTVFWGSVFNSYFWIDPATGIAGALFGMVRPFADPAVLETAGALELAAYADA